MRRTAVRIGALLVGLLLLYALPLWLRPYGVYLLSLWAVYAIAAVGLNLTLGYAGQVSLAQAAFVGIGAYAAALLLPRDVPFVATLVLGAGLGFATGWLLGYPALRVRHHYLAFVTLGANTLFFLLVRNEEWLTGGVYGIVGIPRPAIFGLDLSGPLGWYYACATALVLVTLLVHGILRSPWGRAFVALRENPVRAESLGVDTRLYTLLAFAIGSGLGAVAGAFYAPLVQYVDPSPFSLGLSLNLLLMVVVGGAGRLFGPHLGAAVAVLLPEWLRFSEGLYLMLYATVVVLVLVFAPGGLMAIGERLLAARPPRSRAAEPGA